jgi:conjugal transfer pilus assembly protein TraE
MAWGLFMAQLLGNVTPGSTELILNALDPLLAPTIYQPVHDAVAEQQSCQGLTPATMKVG